MPIFTIKTTARAKIEEIITVEAKDEESAKNAIYGDDSEETGGVIVSIHDRVAGDEEDREIVSIEVVSDNLATLRARQDVEQVIELTPGVFEVIDDVGSACDGSFAQVIAWLDAGLDNSGDR